MEYLEKLQRLFLSDKEQMNAKEFLQVQRVNKAEKDMLSKFLEENYLEKISIGKSTCYKIGKNGYSFLQDSDIWEQLLSEKKEKEQKQLEKIIGYLERLYLLPQKPAEGKKILNVSKYGAKEKDLINKLTKDKYLEAVTSGNKKLYLLGEEGQALLFKDQERWRQLGEEKEKLQKQRQLEFLEFLKKHDTKKVLTKAIQNKYKEEIQSTLLDNSIKELGTNKYALTLKGENILFMAQPPEQILSHLETCIEGAVSLSHKVQESINNFAKNKEFSRRFQENLKTNLQNLENHISLSFKNLKTIQNDIQEQIKEEENKEILLERFRKLELFIQTEENRITSHFENRNAQIEKEVQAQIEPQTLQILQQQQELSKRLQNLETLQQEILTRISSKDTPQKPIENTQKPLPTPKYPSPQPLLSRRETKSSQKVFQSFMDTYQELCRQNPYLAGSIPIPEMYDILKSNQVFYHLNEFHKYLLELLENGVITLQICNSPSFETRANEGIQSEQGLLFYIKMG